LKKGAFAKLYRNCEETSVNQLEEELDRGF